MASKSLSLCKSLPTCQVERMSRGPGKRALSIATSRSLTTRCNVVERRCLRPVLNSSPRTTNGSSVYASSRIQTRCLAAATTGPRTIQSNLDPYSSASDILLADLGNPRLEKRIDFKDRNAALDGAVNLAFSAVAKRYGNAKGDIGVIGLKGGHDDKLKGYFFDFPMVKLLEGRWRVESPLGMKREFGRRRNFETLGEIFDLESRFEGSDGQHYRNVIQATIQAQIDEGKSFGAVVLQPVVLGGSMDFVDPLFQYTLIQVIRSSPQLFSSSASATSDSSWSGLPVIFDETFSGSYRLGRLSAASFIKSHADISLHMENIAGNQCIVLTNSEFASTTPSSSTINTPGPKSQFERSKDEETSLAALQARYSGKRVEGVKENWSSESTAAQADGQWSFWNHDFVKKISTSEAVRNVMALGSVLHVTLHAENTGSWSPKTASGLQKRILLEDPKETDFKTRVSGDKSFYVVGNTTTKAYKYKVVQDIISNALVKEGK